MNALQSGVPSVRDPTEWFSQNYDKANSCVAVLKVSPCLGLLFFDGPAGVPKSRRGEIWQFLAVQHRVRHRLPNKQQPPDISYKELLKQLTAQQHAILVDLGKSVLSDWFCGSLSEKHTSQNRSCC